MESWCPKSGAVRQFMEIVCTALSRNPHITVAKKLEHIQWFQDYFEEPGHHDILRAAGALEEQPQQQLS